MPKSKADFFEVSWFPSARLVRTVPLPAFPPSPFPSLVLRLFRRLGYWPGPGLGAVDSDLAFLSPCLPYRVHSPLFGASLGRRWLGALF